MRVYLAGPEVFLADRDTISAEKKAICAQHGMIGVFPTDPAPATPQADTGWMRIYLGNEAHIHGCDALIANLTPFRGASADPGTRLRKLSPIAPATRARIASARDASRARERLLTWIVAASS